MKHKLDDLNKRIGPTLISLWILARCADASACQAALGNVRNPLGWFNLMQQCREMWAAYLREVDRLNLAARGTIDNADRDLAELRKRKPPLVGSREYNDLAERVEAIEVQRAEAENFLNGQASSPALVPSDFLERLELGARNAAAWLVEREARLQLDVCARGVREVAGLATRDVLTVAENFDILTKAASGFAGEHIEAPRLVLPELDAWRTIAQATPPNLEAAAN